MDGDRRGKTPDSLPGSRQPSWYRSLEPEERPISEPFWQIDSVADGLVVVRVLRERFSVEYAILSSSLEEADPCEIVYPGNLDEYGDVVLEILVLLAPENVRLANLSQARIDEVVREALSRRFSEMPADERVRHAITLICERRSTISQ